MSAKRKKLKPPTWLSKAGAAMFKRMLPVVEAAGLTLTVADENLLGIYCRTLLRWRAADDELSDRLIIIGRDGGEVLNPLFRAVIGLQRQLDTVGKSLGLSPKSRLALLRDVTGHGAPDEIEEWLAEEDEKAAKLRISG